MRARLDAHRANPSQRSGLLGVQIALSAIVLGAALLAPPARGTMLAIPLAPSARTVADWTLSAGARIVGTGRLPGSLIITGSRDRLLIAALRHGALLTAAPDLLCSGRRTSAAASPPPEPAPSPTKERP